MMAKETKKIAFTNATLDLENMTISEFDRDGEEVVYDLREIMADYSGVAGISFSLGKSEEINGYAPDEMEELNDDR